MTTQNEESFVFDISLSVLNHLGRNLYRNFVTVLGEAISNAWDAEAKNVWIYVNRESSTFVIADDGIGMTREDFQGKFLRIGYSKRQGGHNKSLNLGRPFIGQKGIGKLALLSCAQKIYIASKTETAEFIGGSIDNSELDEAIKDDVSASKYPLGNPDMDLLSDYTKDIKHGTVLYFSELNNGVYNTLDYLRQAIALYFRFSLFDPDFKIFFNNEQITVNDLDKLTGTTEFLWTINQLEDPLIEKLQKSVLEQDDRVVEGADIKGFIASVKLPRNLKVFGTNEKAGVDLFVNGRLRERDILKHNPTARIPESYIYGQIHLNSLDEGSDDIDRFVSSREGVVADDPIFRKALTTINDLLTKKGGIFDQWDEWRLKHKKEGDSDNTRKNKKQRASTTLFNEVVDDYAELEGVAPSGDSAEQLPTGSDVVKSWADAFAEDAAFNFQSYAECFVAENLIREFISHTGTTLSQKAQEAIKSFKEKETNNKRTGNVNIDIRLNNQDTSYLDMSGLANLVDKGGEVYRLSQDAKTYKPLRDALMHTARLTDAAKVRITSVYDNMKGRLKTMLQDDSNV